MIVYAIIYGVIAVLAYVLLSRYRNMNSNALWHDNAMDAWGALIFSVIWPLTILIEAYIIFDTYVPPVINRAVHSLHRRAQR